MKAFWPTRHTGIDNDSQTFPVSVVSIKVNQKGDDSNSSFSFCLGVFIVAWQVLFSFFFQDHIKQMLFIIYIKRLGFKGTISLVFAIHPVLFVGTSFYLFGSDPRKKIFCRNQEPSGIPFVLKIWFSPTSNQTPDQRRVYILVHFSSFVNVT